MTLARYATVVALASWLAFALRPHVLYDDAAITFRYVDRFVEGRGLTFNDHERVQGLSNPLYALVLSAFVRGGLPVESAARTVDVVCYVLSVAFTTLLASRLAGSRAGWLAGTALAVDAFYRDNVLCGMESGLSVVLGLLVVLCLLEGAEVAAGLLIGLALWNKLDASLLAAAAVTATWIVHGRRVTIRLLGAAAMVIVPGVVVAYLYFGSTVPQSLVTKLAGHGVSAYDHWWVVHVLSRDLRWVWLALWMPALWGVRTLPARARAAVLALVGWFTLHAALLTAVDFGDNYPWYLPVLMPPVVIVAAFGVTALRNGLSGQSSRSQARLVGAAALVCFALAAGIIGWNTNVARLRLHNPLSVFEAFDADRRLAGRFVGRFSQDHEVVASYFGWVAFESDRPFNDLMRLNTVKDLPDPAYVVLTGDPWRGASARPDGPPGYLRVAEFRLAHRLIPEEGYSWMTVFAAPRSAIAQSGRRMLTLLAADLPQPESVSGVLAPADARVDGESILVPVPSGLVYRMDAARADGGRLIFTPRLDSADGSSRDATVRVLLNGRTIFDRRVSARQPLQRVVIDLDTARVETLTFEVSDLLPTQERATFRWQDVRLILGPANVDLEGLDPEVIAQWNAHVE